MILLTGHRGYIGKHLHSALEAEGYDVVGFDCSNRSYKLWDFEFGRWLKRDRVYDVIIHCGAVPDSQTTDPDILNLNVHATDSLLNVFSDPDEYNPYFLYFSSALVSYPNTLYSHSKSISEKIVRAKSDNHLIMRPFNVFGGTELQNRHSVIRKLEDGTLEHLFPNWVRDYIHVDEVCRAVVFFLKYRPTGTVDVGTALPTNLGVLGDVMGRPAHHSDPRDVLQVPAPDSMVSQVNKMSYFPKTNLIDYLKKQGYERADEIKEKGDFNG